MYQSSFSEKGGFFEKIAAGTIKAHRDMPFVVSAFMPFPRYIANQFKFVYEHAPLIGMLPVSKKATKELQDAAGATYEDYNDPSYKVDGIFGKGSLKMLIAGMRSAKTKPTRESFEKNIFPNSTLDIEIIKWLEF